MLIFNPKRVLALRGVENQLNFLLKNGFVRATAVNMLDGRASQVKTEHLEKLCGLLNCTPNDLFEWRATEKSVQLSEKHQLRNLQRSDAAASLKELVKDVPIDRLSEVAALLDEMKNQ